MSNNKLPDVEEVRSVLRDLRDCSRRTPDRLAADTVDEARSLIERLSQALKEARANQVVFEEVTDTK